MPDVLALSKRLASDFYWKRLHPLRVRRRSARIYTHFAAEGSAPARIAMLCGPHFDETIPNAATKIRLGMVHGFRRLGCAAGLAPLRDLAGITEDAETICMLAESDYEYLTAAQMRILARTRHFVWVSPWFDGASNFYATHNIEGLAVSERVRRRVLQAQPELVFAPVTASSLEFYAGWQRAGICVLPLPFACDTDVYGRVDGPRRFHAELAFVGGYWPYKARQFELFLRPYEDQLDVYGYSEWPYSGYRGVLTDGDEPILYRDAVLCPSISEPHAALTGDVVERAYKIMGSGGLCVADPTPQYRELFNDDEILLPSSVAEYHEIVRAVLASPDAYADYREKGYQAVHARHTYVHRARTIMEALRLC